MKAKTRKLNYHDDAILFMKSLLSNEQRGIARAIKEVLLEVCRQGIEYPNLIAQGDVKNTYRLHIPAIENDETYIQGFRVFLIIMEYHVLVTSIEPEYS